MKHMFANSTCFAFVALFCLGFVFSQEPAPREIDDFAGLRIRVIDPNGNALKPIPDAEFPKDLQIPAGAVAHCFRYKDKTCVVLVNKAAAQPGTCAFGVNSSFGELSIGIEAPGTKKLPETVAKESSAEFKLARSKSLVDWSGAEATFIVPKPRKELSVSLAEYGAQDRWKDVTDIVRKQLSGGSLNFQGSNVLFGGDPAPGVVKSLIVTYSLDDDEQIQTFGENARVRVQYDSKDHYFRLTPKSADTFKFVIRQAM